MTRNSTIRSGHNRVGWKRQLARRVGRAAALQLAVIGGAGVTYRLLRGGAEQWRCTDEEVHAVLPGDDLIDDPFTTMTRAITIEAPPAEVWPWIAQFGQGRGGLYSYDWLENLAGCDIHSLDHIDPALQRISADDRIQITPEGYPADLGMVVDEVDPERALVLRLSTAKQPFARYEAPWTWTFVLTPTVDGRTRLVTRERYRSNGGAADTLSRHIVGPIDFVMSRRMLTGIAERAERATATGPGPGGTGHRSPPESLWFGALVFAGAVLAALLGSRLSFRTRLLVAAGGGAGLTLLAGPGWAPIRPPTR